MIFDFLLLSGELERARSKHCSARDHVFVRTLVSTCSRFLPPPAFPTTAMTHYYNVKHKTGTLGLSYMAKMHTTMHGNFI